MPDAAQAPLSAGPAVATPVTDAAPPPPSTGREMPQQEAVQPQITPEQAAKIIAAAIEERKKPSEARDCRGVMQFLIPALQVAAPNPTQENWPAYEVLQGCLHTLGIWRSLLQVSYAMLDVSPQQARPYFLPRALIGLGQYDLAGKAIQKLGVVYPNNVELVTAAGFLTCAQAQWADCGRVADVTLQHVDEEADLAIRRDILIRTHFFRLQALFHLRKLDEADAAAADMDKVLPGDPMVAYLKQQLALARSTGLGVDSVWQTQIPLGSYHLYGTAPESVGGSVVAFTLTNFAGADRQLRLEAEITGLTDRTSQTVMLLRDGTQTVRLVPPLRFGFDIGGLRADRQAQLAWKITAVEPGGERVLYDETTNVNVLPRDSLILSRKVAADTIVPAYELIGAWVTPNARAIDEFLSAAKKRAPRETFAGEQTATGPQVKAIWDELQARGVSYVMDPMLLTDIGTVQRTRLPSEVLASTNAQCLEGAILFATLMEAVGLHPIIVLVPGHAFVGWHGTAQDGVPAGTPLFVETTMVHDAKFEEAVTVAMRRVQEENTRGNFERGVSTLIELAQLRQRGVTPQPTD